MHTINTAPWWTYQPKSNIKKTCPAKARPISFSFGYLKVIKMKKMGCFRGFKRATVPQRHMYEQTIILAICGQNWMGPWNLEQKWGWKVYFILWHFLIWSQITELLTFLVLRLKCTVTLLELRKHPIFFILVTLKYQKLKEFGHNFAGGIFLIFDLGWYVHQVAVICGWPLSNLINPH